jgi:PIN domain nuclease of toxin-antitoxin system
MKLLLDTHAFIWWDSAPDEMSERASTLCRDPANELILSVASLWEMQVKAQLGKLTLRKPLRFLVEEQREANGLQLLSIQPEHTFALDSLPLLHKDPFDRIIVAQAKVEGLRLLSHDSIIHEYPVVVEW